MMPDPKDIDNSLINQDNSSKSVEHPNTGATEIGGREGPEPTRYGDWEVGGKCVDF